MKKIIAFISTLTNGFSLAKPADVYTCPDGTSVTGRQTNEAPVKYLLRSVPDIREIVCIVSDEAMEEAQVPGEDGEPVRLSAMDYFYNSIRDEHPEVELEPIEYRQEMDFNRDILPEVLKLVTDEDEIFLETTGGIRSTVSQLMLLSQILTYQGTKLSGAVYSNLQTRRIENVLDSYRSFDLITGLNEFERFCSVRSLRSYYGDAKKLPKRLRELLNAMQKLSDCVVLCRTECLDDRVKEFQKALRSAEQSEDALLHALLPLYQRKFRALGSTLQQLRWCEENNLIQQAFTIYTDRLPKYLMEERNILTAGQSPQYDPEDQKKTVGKEANYAALNLGFLYMSKRQFTSGGTDYSGATIDQLEELLKKDPTCGIHPSLEIADVQQVLRDYLYAKVLRNQLNHSQEGLKPQAHTERYLNQWNYRKLDDLSLEQVRRFLRDACARLEAVVQKTGQEP